MKIPIAIALFCTSLFACHASDQGSENNSITVNDGSLSSTIESTQAVDGPSIVGPLIISALFSADGPSGPAPYTHMEATCKKPTKVGNVGDGCCGDLVAPKLRVTGSSAPHNHTTDLTTPSN